MKFIKSLASLFALVAIVSGCGGEAISGGGEVETVGKTAQALVSGNYMSPIMDYVTFAAMRAREYIPNCQCTVWTDIWQYQSGVTDGSGGIEAKITKTTGSYAWDAGASTTYNMATNGYFEFSTAEANTDKMVGLSVWDSNQDYTDIDYALYMASDGTLRVYEAGAGRGIVGSYVANDKFRVKRSGTVVTYWKLVGATWTLLYTSTVPSYPASATLLLDTSIYTPGATITKVNTPETQYFLFLGTYAAGGALWEWQWDIDVLADPHPKALITPAAYNIFLNGSCNPATGVVTYGGNTYKMRMVRDATGALIGEFVLM